MVEHGDIMAPRGVSERPVDSAGATRHLDGPCPVADRVRLEGSDRREELIRMTKYVIGPDVAMRVAQERAGDSR
jgi:hypothetical protein